MCVIHKERWTLWIFFFLGHGHNQSYDRKLPTLTFLLLFCCCFVVGVADQKTQRQTGRPAQLANIRAARAVASIIRTTLGPQSMLKMLLDPMGSIVLTNDGHAI